MTDAEARAVAEAVVAALDRPGRPRTAPAPEPKNGHLTKWAGAVAGVLAAGAVVAALTTWRALGVVEAEQDALQVTVGEIRSDTKAMRSQLDQLVGRLGAPTP